MCVQGLGGNQDTMQQMMSQMQDNPAIQSMLNNPDMLRSMLQNNPMVQQVCECLCVLMCVCVIVRVCLSHCVCVLATAHA